MPADGRLSISIAGLSLSADLEIVKAPRTCAAFRRLLPLRGHLMQARWSGEAAWIPLGDQRLDLDFENQTSYPAPGEILLYPGGISEMEILFPYGATRFASKVGQLAGNHVATIIDSRDAIAELGRLVLWNGAQEIVIEERS
jgi:hypothetical protein